MAGMTVHPVDLTTDLAPFVVEVVAWLDEWPPELVGLIRAAPSEVLALERVGLAECEAVEVRWGLNEIAEHALLLLAALSLVDGQPMIPQLAIRSATRAPTGTAAHPRARRARDDGGPTA